MIDFVIKNCYSILFTIFMVLNYKLLNVWYPLAWNSNFILFVWLSMHVVAYFGYVKPAELEFQKRMGYHNGDKTE